MATLTYLNSRYIIRGTLSIAENALGRQDLVSVSIGNQTRITVDPELVGYGGDNNARSWRITGKNFQLEDETKEYFVYIKCQRNTQDAALFMSAFRYDLNGFRVDATGNPVEDTLVTDDGSEIDLNTGDSSNYYVSIGRISEVSGNKREATIDMGRYGTDAGENDSLLSVVEQAVMSALTSIKDWIKGAFLSKEHDDETRHKLTMAKAEVAPEYNGTQKQESNVGEDVVATYGKTLDSLLAGSGALIDKHGRLQVNDLEVRGSMTVMELVINQLHAMDGEYYFGDAATIERVDAIAEGDFMPCYAGNGQVMYWEDGTPVNALYRAYKLYFRKDADKRGADGADGMDAYKWRIGDIILSVISNLHSTGAGAPRYYQSWMRCTGVDMQEHSITVVLYADALCGTTNHAPEAGFVCVRRGNNNTGVYGPEGSARENRQSAWWLSARDGTMSYLDNLDKPIIEDYNYKLLLGKFPSIGPMKNYAGDIGLYAQTILYSNLQQVNWIGKVVHQYEYLGEWDAMNAARGMYRYRREKDPAGWTNIIQSQVSCDGFKWGCLGSADPSRDHALERPAWNSVEWAVVEGGRPDEYAIEIDSSAGNSFYVNRVDTVLTGRLLFNGMDITEQAVLSSGVTWRWKRETGNTPSDNTWNQNWLAGKRHEDETDCPTRNMLHVNNTDMGPAWSKDLACTFILEATIQVGTETYSAEAQVEFG